MKTCHSSPPDALRINEWYQALIEVVVNWVIKTEQWNLSLLKKSAPRYLL